MRLNLHDPQMWWNNQMEMKRNAKPFSLMCMMSDYNPISSR